MKARIQKTDGTIIELDGTPDEVTAVVAQVGDKTAGDGLPYSLFDAKADGLEDIAGLD